MLAPILEQLARELAGRIDMVKVDIDREPQLAAMFGIRSVPTVILFQGGRPATQFSGVLPPEAIRRVLEPFLPRASDAVIERARTLLDGGDAAQAVALLRDAHAAEPDNYRIHPVLGRALLATGALDDAETLLRELPPNVAHDDDMQRLAAHLGFARIAADSPPLPELERRLASDGVDHDTRFALAAHKVLAGDYETALDHLLEIIRADRAYRDDGARRAMVDVFTLLNNEGPVVRRYRGLLSAALN
jgi:putative thioredoxin